MPRHKTLAASLFISLWGLLLLSAAASRAPRNDGAVALGVGWNFVSLPLRPSTPYTAESVCGEINAQGGSVTHIVRWHNGGWDPHVCGVPFNDFPIELEQGYLVRSDQTGDWVVDGQPITSGFSLDIGVGWNAIGLAPSSAYTAERFCADVGSQGGSLEQVVRWRNGGWDPHVCGVPFNDFALARGEGFFVKSDTALNATIPLPAATATWTPVAPPTLTSTPSHTATDVPAPTPTLTPSRTATLRPTATRIPTHTRMPTSTSSPTVTSAGTRTLTHTLTPFPTRRATMTRTLTRSPTNTPTLAPPSSCVPSLISPEDGAVLDNGRTDRLDEIVWDFDWSNCVRATRYHLYVRHLGASAPVIDRILTVSNYRHVEEGAYITNENRFNWTWKVRAMVRERWGAWSEIRTFDVEPVNSDPPSN